jgi:hypothetical protein
LPARLTTWTPRALASNAHRYTSEVWRVVEAQHVVSTMRLVDSLADQLALESILEESKPALPPEVEGLHYLLSTPFRHRSAIGSRFRAPFDPGVWYGAEELRTALAEKSYWRLRFLLDSPQTPDLDPVPHTAFTASIRGAAVDLRDSPFARDREVWTDRNTYGPTQAFAAIAREADVQVIRYQSVRDPEHGGCAAVLTPEAFAARKPRKQETWFIAASRRRVRCAQELRAEAGWEFTHEELTGT